METTDERWCEAEINRVAGEIELIAPEPDAANAQMYFERPLSVTRAQQTKSWDLRTDMSMARLWRDQGTGMRPAIFSLAYDFAFATGGPRPQIQELAALGFPK